MSDGPRYGGLILGLWGNVDEKVGDGIAKKGKQLLPQFFKTFLDSTFNTNSDFAIKYDLTQFFDQVMGVLS